MRYLIPLFLVLAYASSAQAQCVSNCPCGCKSGLSGRVNAGIQFQPRPAVRSYDGYYPQGDSRPIILYHYHHFPEGRGTPAFFPEPAARGSLGGSLELRSGER
jgi:hypothetical protein